ncbi:MAG: OsmC family protein [bacterium]
MALEATVRWVDKMQFVGVSGSNHALVMDTGAEHNGTDTGAKPMELLLVALAGCSGMDVVSLLKKMRVGFSGLELKVRGETREEHPRIFTRIDLEYIIYGPSVDEVAVKRAIELSQEKYCSVTALIKDACPVIYRYRIVQTKDTLNA